MLWFHIKRQRTQENKYVDTHIAYLVEPELQHIRIILNIGKMSYKNRTVKVNFLKH